MQSHNVKYRKSCTSFDMLKVMNNGWNSQASIVALSFKTAIYYTLRTKFWVNIRYEQYVYDCSFMLTATCKSLLLHSSILSDDCCIVVYSTLIFSLILCNLCLQFEYDLYLQNCYLLQEPQLCSPLYIATAASWLLNVLCILLCHESYLC